ncbi:MAG TPA: glycosyltransferase [Anaerolineales bacterium]|nr:glycosyltransferase [Anaerolineae bacterium]HIQ01243.1 glycosyltransferase [Anaerolineales bacterium]
MARILVVYKEFPAPSVGHAGGQAVFRLMASLHRRGYRLFLVARLRREESPLVEEMTPFCERVITVPHHQALPGPFPLAFLRSYLALRRATARALREVRPDLLHVEVTQTAFALLGLRRPFSSFRPLDVNWFLLEQQAAWLRGLRRGLTLALSRLLRGVEPWLCRRYDLIGAISEGDRRLLAPHCQPRPVLLLPLVPAFAASSGVRPAVSPGPNVLFVGAMYRTFNVQGVRWFLAEVWPQVLARVPEARFYVVGHRPPPEVRARHDGEHVFVTGFVEDLAPWYRAASVFVSPLLVAGGLLQKVVDALAMGVGVVATSVSNHGVGGTPGQHLLVADDPAGFAEAVVRLLEDPAERERLGRAGQRFVWERYDLERAVDRWEAAVGENNRTSG